MDDSPGLRERTRRAVRREIAAAACTLFVERGYAATTVADVAAAVGMSQRSVFRYFATKEDMLVGKIDLVTDDLLAALRARPLDEPVWCSLLALVDQLLTGGTDDGGGAPGVGGTPGVGGGGAALALTGPVLRVVLEVPAVRAAYLDRTHRLQEQLVAVLHERAATAGSAYATDDPTPRVLVATLFGCFLAAQHTWLADGARGDLALAVARATALVGPVTGP